MPNLASKIRFILLFILIAFIAASYLPSNFIAGKGSLGKYSNYIEGITLVLLFISGNLINAVRSRPLFFFIASAAIAAIFQCIFFGLGMIESVTELSNILIALAITVIGYNSSMDRRQIFILLLEFIIAVTYVAFVQIQKNIGGFVIEDVYLVSIKNSLGPLLAIGGIAAFYLCMEHRLTTNYWIDRFLKLFLILTSFFCLFEMLTMRARTATIAYVFILIFLIFQIVRKPKYKRYRGALITTLFVVVITILLNTSFEDYLYNSFMQNKEEDVFSERGERNRAALEVFSESPWWGNMTSERQIAWVHNYPLRILSDYGFMGSFPLLILYLYLSLTLIKKCLKIKINEFENIGYVLLSISFIVSMAEPTYPYGPGTVNLLPFLLFGIALHSDQNPLKDEKKHRHTHNY